MSVHVVSCLSAASVRTKDMSPHAMDKSVFRVRPSKLKKSYAENIHLPVELSHYAKACTNSTVPSSQSSRLQNASIPLTNSDLDASYCLARI